MNLFTQFKELIREPRLQIGTVLSITDGTASIELPSGGVIYARGQAAVGDQVFVRNSVIEGVAPSMPVVSIEV
jgi:hypothetical protein